MATSAPKRDILDHVTCSICIEPYRDPRLLPCGHSFCTECITQYAKSSGLVQCPECRHVIKITSAEINKLQKNFQLAAISSKFAENADEDINVPTCIAHKQDLSVFCNSCETIICVGCCSSSHEGHVIGNIDKEYQRAQTILKKKIEQANAAEQSLLLTIQRNRDHLAAIDLEKKWLLTAVGEDIRGLQSKLNRKEKEVKESIDKRMQTEANSFSKQVVVCQERRSIFQKELVQCSELLSKAKGQVLQDYKLTVDSFEKALTAANAVSNWQTQTEMMVKSGNVNYGRVEDAIEQLQFCWDDLRGETTNERNIATLESRVKQLERDLRQAEKEKDPALLRLSEEASKKLDHGNPNIADSRDENCATKLAEKMSDLYDDQWTDAYTAMCENPKYPEKTIIQHLLKIVKTVYDVSRRMSEAQSKQLTEAIACFNGCSEKDAVVEEKHIPALTFEKRISRTHLNKAMHTLQFVAGTYVNLKALSDVRKINHDSATDDVEKAVMKLFKTNSIHTGVCDEALPFMKACIPLCWLMCIQEPPVVIWMDIHMGDVLDKNQVRTYTVDGDQVDYMVWPVVFLHDGGPLLAKGVVQAIPKRKDNRLNQTIDGNNMRNSPKSVKNHRGSKVMSVGASGHNKDSSSKAFTEGFTIKNAEKQPILFSKKTNATGESETMVSQHERKGQTSNQGNMIKASQNGQMLKGPAPRVPIQQSTNAVPTNQELRKGPDPVRNLEHSGTQNGKPTSSGPTTHGKTGQLNVARIQVGEQGTTISGNLSAPKTDKRASSGKVLNGDKRDRDRPQPGHVQSTKSMFVGSGPSNQEERKSRNYFSQTEHSHL